MGLRVTGGLTFGPKPGAVDKGSLEIFEVNLDPINDTYIHTDDETSRRSLGDPTIPLQSLGKDSVFNFWAPKFKYMAPKFKYVAPKFKYVAPNIQIFDPKFK